VDVADDRPVPTGRQLASVIDASVKGVVIAPLYGHPGEALDAVLAALGTCSLFLDLAQGIGLRHIEPLLVRSDAAGFSFGIGKGLDTGGGLLLTRHALQYSASSVASLGVGSLARSAVLRAIAGCGLYGLVARGVERAAEAGPKAFEPRIRVLRDQWVYGWWQRRLVTFLEEVGLAQTRAAILGVRFGGHPALAFTEACFSPNATHLRQIIRLADAGRRDITVERLRQGGIDCAPAGERLPSTYIPGERGDYPAARRFVADSIRMPFLGRLCEREFAHLADALERALA
jgi:dTDP-4-amino-4,6-dideoxygalactose transaminase